MKPKNLHKLLLLDLLFVLNSWIKDPNRSLIQRTPLLAPWLEDLTRTHAQLLSFQPVHVALGAEGPKRDRRAEASVRVLQLSLQLGAELARAEGHEDQDPAVTRWEEAQTAVFPDGTRFLLHAWPQQVSACDRALEQAATPSVQSLDSAFSAHGRSLAQVLSLVASSNNDLRALTQDRIEAAANPPTTTPPSEAAVRRHARACVKNFLSAINQAFPAQDAEAEAAQNSLLAPLKERLDALQPPPSSPPPTPTEGE